MYAANLHMQLLCFTDPPKRQFWQIYLFRGRVEIPQPVHKVPEGHLELCTIRNTQSRKKLKHSKQQRQSSKFLTLHSQKENIAFTKKSRVCQISDHQYL